MKSRVFPVLLVTLLVATPVFACVAPSMETGASDMPMDMAGGCTDEGSSGSSPAVCSANVAISPAPQVELPQTLIAIVPSWEGIERLGNGSPEIPVLRPPSRPPGAVPLYKVHAAYLI
jgi:hypothetical protein